jgi:hypothetical protein
LEHEFIGGMYRRTILMYAGCTVTSLVHNQDHPFFVLAGKFLVYDENNGTQLIEAPYKGETKKGTRRVLEIIEDTVFSTIHITDIVPENETDEAIEKAAAKVVDEVTEHRVNTVIGERIINNGIAPNLIKDKN